MNLEVYSEVQLKAVEGHIEKYFGSEEMVSHEFCSFDIHVDIEIIKPTPEKDYYTLATVGMGAHLMAVLEKLSARRLERAELIMCLPPDWDCNGKDTKDT